MTVHVIPDIINESVVETTDKEIPQPNIFKEFLDLQTQVRKGQRPEGDKRIYYVAKRCQLLRFKVHPERQNQILNLAEISYLPGEI